MSNTGKTVGVVVAEDAPQPPGLEDIANAAELRILRTAAEFANALPHLDALAVYDFRTSFLRDADLSRADRLRWIHAASAGVDAVLTPQVLVRDDIVVTNSQGVFNAGIAEYVLGSMLMAAKDFLVSLTLQRASRWQHRESRLLRGQHLLVAGVGSIGTDVARLAQAAGVRVTGITRNAREDADIGYVYPTAELPRLIPDADFVAICLPLTHETRGLFDGNLIGKMKPESWLINVGRGPVVHEPALIDALQNGRLAGAVLDVFEEEPLPSDSPLWDMENVVITPHMAGDVVGWTEELSRVFVENFRRWHQGGQVMNVVDKAKQAALQEGKGGS